MQFMWLNEIGCSTLKETAIAQAYNIVYRDGIAMVHVNIAPLHAVEYNMA